MAGTINYTHSPNDPVYVINKCEDVNKQQYVISGVVVRVRAEVLVTGDKVTYDVRMSNSNGTKEFHSDDVFANKADAITEYESRVA
jgi:hypothetical protein